MAEIVKYKEAQEQKHPSESWDGNVPVSYSITLEDGTEARVGKWVSYRMQDRRKRLAKGIEEKSLAEKRLDEIGILWDARGSRKKDRKKRLAKGVEEQSLGEERLDEIGISWEAPTIEVDDVIYI